jgi:GNAT superfamily N-acetyltransferase
MLPAEAPGRLEVWLGGDPPLDLREIVVRPLCSCDEPRYQELMRQHHYLGALPKISETLWYVATWREEWVALLSFSAAALKCAVRDRWIGWNFRQRYSRLKLIVNNSRFLILPDWHRANLGSRVLSLCQGRLASDWEERFGHGVVLVETFVDPQRFRGTVYRAANWVYVGNTKGFHRTRLGYTARPQSPKMVFVQPLRADARSLLSQAVLPPPYQIGGSKIMLSAAQMQSLPAFFREIPDPRRAQGRRHRLSTLLGIAAGAVLCGMRGYKAIADGAESLGQKARERFGCRRQGGRYVVPSESIIRNVLIRVEPAHLDRALRRWNETYAGKDESLAIDGKTMCNALDEEGRQIHVMSVVGHQTQTCYTPKKSAPCR